MITGENYRITVLTDRLIRLEYSEDNTFEDRKSFAVVSRDLGEVPVEAHDTPEGLVIETKELKLCYDKQPFSSYGLSIELKSLGTKWNYSENHGDFSNLGGTARTLDDADGRVRLEKGIFGRDGFAVLDDSKTPVMDNGEFVQRKEGAIDIYFFGYGKDYYGGLRDFCRLCGKMPMIPRYALGNWWSRYYRYTEDSYMEVVDKFAKEQIPLSVAVIDMDWHLTEVDPKYGSGWTGYTWNKDLFPDYKRFLKKLHDNNLSVTLNLHPADGIRAFEDMYPDMARALGIDPETQAPAEFDFGSSAYRKAYFDTVIHPYEKDGVDFWWIDWQQGTGKKCGDVDPLLLLNHYHYLDQEKRNTRPMIFSRYAGPGSHRYPIGFSGDTHVTWKSLKFQPYFTSTASNIGFGCWSHDIGGHMLGDKDLTRLIRWIQYGVFSPINRIHSSNSPFFNKEPWVLTEPYRSIMREFMQLRHKLIPYLYTENFRAYKESRPLVRPMYYDNSENPESYRLGDQYRFGENLLVSAITEENSKDLQMGSTRALIPAGRWYDIFDGRIYEGEKIVRLFRELSRIPVLLKAGGIVPLSGDDVTVNSTANPAHLHLLIGGGAEGSYTLYEDDGISMDFEKGAYVETTYSMEYNPSTKKLTFTINPAEGDTSLIPQTRSYTLEFFGISAANGKHTGKSVVVDITAFNVTEGQTIELTEVELTTNDYHALAFEILDRAWISTTNKDMVFDKLQSLDKASFASWLKAADVSEALKRAIEEVL
jgi:alpha-glucosidase (family GH31 glycosyl hydrolase)